MKRLLLLFLLSAPSWSLAAEAPSISCEDERDQFSYRYRMAQQVLEQREQELANLIVQLTKVRKELATAKPPAPEKKQ